MDGVRSQYAVHRDKPQFQTSYALPEDHNNQAEVSDQHLSVNLALMVIKGQFL